MADERPVLLLTRPARQAGRFLEMCRAQIPEMDAVVSPVLEIAPITVEVDPGRYTGLIFTSENGVLAFAEVQDLEGRTVWAVGEQTAETARELGATAQSAAGTADDLVAMLRAGGVTGRLLHVRGRHARGDVARRLTQAGLQVEEAILYDQAEARPGADALALLSGSRPVILPLFSPRSAALVSAWVGPGAAPLNVITMSEAVTRAWNPSVESYVVTADRADAAAMAESVCAMYRRATRLEAPGRYG